MNEQRKEEERKRGRRIDGRKLEPLEQSITA